MRIVGRTLSRPPGAPDKARPTICFTEQATMLALILSSAERAPASSDPNPWLHVPRLLLLFASFWHV